MTIYNTTYLAFHQHGDVYKHVVQLLDTAFQTDNVFVSRFNLTQGLFRNPRVYNLYEKRHTDFFTTHKKERKDFSKLEIHTLPTPAVNTAALPLSNISSSSSSVVAFPAEWNAKYDLYLFIRKEYHKQ